MGDVEAAFGSLGANGGFVDASGYEVEPLTPLLARAQGLRLRPALRGVLDGEPAVIGHLSYGGGHAVGAESDLVFEFIVVITGIAESAAVVPRLFCRNRDRVDSVGGMGMSLDAELLWTESVELGRRYEVATSPYQDPNWMLQLFSPDFIDWLVTAPSEGFAFELAYGDLVASIPAAGASAQSVASLWESAGSVAKRIRRECAEGAPP